LFIVAIIIIFGGKLITEFNTHYQGSSASVESKSIMDDNEGRFTNIFDGIFTFAFVLMIIAVFISLFLLDTHPAAFFIVIIVFAFILIPLGILGNVFEDFTNTSSITTTATAFTYTGYIMSHWLIIITVCGFIGMVLLFAKLKGAV
jgi:hypothetical protein